MSSSQQRVVVICSGGLDSVTLAYKVKKERQLIGLIAFNYRQRHQKELDFAATAASTLKVPFRLVDISSVGKLLSSALTTPREIDVPQGHYTADTMKSTVVPNRNAIMLSIGFGYAASVEADAVAIAVHGGDHPIYADCRPDFMKAFEKMERRSLAGVAEIDLHTPFIQRDKAAIVKEGAALNVPFENTWSCYMGGRIHCGRCGTCVERQEAFYQAEIEDPTPYEDSQFWKKEVGIS